MSKACKINFSVKLLLELIGLKDADGLMVYAADINPKNEDIVTLYLHGEHPDLPELNVGDDVPEMIILCEKIRSRLQIRDAK